MYIVRNASAHNGCQPNPSLSLSPDKHTAYGQDSCQELGYVYYVSCVSCVYCVWFYDVTELRHIFFKSFISFLLKSTVPAGKAAFMRHTGIPPFKSCQMNSVISMTPSSSLMRNRLPL